MTTAASVRRPSRSAPRSTPATRRSSTCAAVHEQRRPRRVVSHAAAARRRRHPRRWSEGPRVPSARSGFGFDATDPNCFERSARFIGAAELIAPGHVYRLATISTPNGLHTFPTWDGVPVVLDPSGSTVTPRIALPRDRADIAARRLRHRAPHRTDETKGLRGDLARARRARSSATTTWVNGEPIDDAIETYETGERRYQATLAELDAERRWRRERRSQRRLRPDRAHAHAGDRLDLRTSRELGPSDCPHGAPREPRPPRDARPCCSCCRSASADAQAVAFVLALAEREARSTACPRSRIVHSTARALDRHRSARR